MEVSSLWRFYSRHYRLLEALSSASSSPSSSSPSSGPASTGVDRNLPLKQDPNALASVLIIYACALAMAGREQDAAEVLTLSARPVGQRQLQLELEAGGCDLLLSQAYTLVALSRLAHIFPSAASVMPTLLEPVAVAAAGEMRRREEEMRTRVDLADLPDLDMPALLQEARAETLLIAATRLVPYDDWSMWLSALEFAGATSDEGLRELTRLRLIDAITVRTTHASGSNSSNSSGASATQQPQQPQQPPQPSESDAWTIHAMDGWAAAGSPLSGAVNAFHFRKIIAVAAQKAVAVSTAKAASGGQSQSDLDNVRGQVLSVGLAAQENGGGAAIMPLARQARALLEMGHQSLELGDLAEAQETASQALQLVSDASRGLDAWLLRRQVNQKTARPPTAAGGVGSGSQQDRWGMVAGAGAGAGGANAGATGAAGGHAAAAQAQAQFEGSEELLLSSAGPAFVIEETLEAVKAATHALQRRVRVLDATGGIADLPLSPEEAMQAARARFLSPHLYASGSTSAALPGLSLLASPTAAAAASSSASDRLLGRH